MCREGEAMEKFCKKCGSPLDNNGKCPNCDKTPRKKDLKAEKKSAKKQAKIDKKAQLTKKQKVKRFFLKFFAVVLAAIIGITGAIFILVYMDKINSPFFNSVYAFLGIKDEKSEVTSAGSEGNSTENMEKESVTEEDPDLKEDYKVPEFDAEKYFKENTDLKSSYGAQSSQNISTESEAYDNFKERGFSVNPITYEYSMDGTYSGDCEILAYSSSEHPMYQTYFTTSNGDIWSVREIDSSFFAIPISYNCADETKPQLVISETDAIISYDSTANKFYINVPDKSKAIIKTVERIDAETLEKLNNEELDKL